VRVCTVVLAANVTVPDVRRVVAGAVAELGLVVKATVTGVDTAD
jgi:hypothetical protein